MSPTFSSLPVAGITCMTPIAPTVALGVLVEPRLLVALRRHQQVVELVLVAVLLEELDQRQELLALGLRRPRSSRTSCSPGSAARSRCRTPMPRPYFADEGVRARPPAAGCSCGSPPPASPPVRSVDVVVHGEVR